MAEPQDIISVIVCTYNQQDTIGRTLESILSQQCTRPVEIVIGEDGSTDRTLAVCQQFHDHHPDQVRILANKANKGFVRNYFDCLRACRGRYIADCAGDDFWLDPHKLEAAARILDANPDVTLVHTDWFRHDRQSGQLTSPGPSACAPGITDGSQLLTDIITPIERPAVHLCTALFRPGPILQAMQEHPRFFDPDRYLCEDIQIAFFLALAGKVAYIDTPTLAYTCGATSISNPDSEERHFRFWANTTRLTHDLAATFGIADSQLDRFLQARIHKLLMHAFRSGKPQLRSQALLLQREMHLADTPRTLLAKLLLLPGIWQPMRLLRDAIKSRK